MDLREELELVYKTYPKKMGKSQGMKHAKKSIRSENDVVLLKLAVFRYKEYIVKHQKKPEYIMYWSTFMNHWQDWLDDSVGKVEMPGQKDKWAELEKRRA